jgi:hypothetical protein
METRRDYLIEKMQCKIDEGVRYSYLSEEIIALEKTMNFIKWINNNSEGITKEIIEKYEEENAERTNETLLEEDTEMNNKKDEVIYGIFDEKLQKTKLRMTLSVIERKGWGSG